MIGRFLNAAVAYTQNFTGNTDGSTGFYQSGPTTYHVDTSLAIGTLLIILLAAFIVALVLLIIPLWKVYKKAGKPGWAAIIPVYGTWVLFEIVGYPGWWAILSLVPIVNIFPAIMGLIAYFKLAKLFGKSDVFGVMLILFPWVCLPILGYGKAQPSGGDQPPQPGASTGAPVAPMPPTPPAQTINPTVVPPVAPTPTVMPPVAPQDQNTPPTPPVPPAAPQPPTNPVQ